MNFEIFQSYVLPALLVVFFGWRIARFRGIKKRMPDLLKQGAIVVDVRSRAEFQTASREGSLNIPLDELDQGATHLDPKKTIVVCCASGVRSAIAATSLRRKGFVNVINAGPWTNTVT